MISLRNISTVSRYERKILLRSWFFRIFSFLAIFLLTLMNIIIFVAPVSASWADRAVAANLPYLNVILINVAQAIIAIFLASDFLRRDRKMDTTETIYSRPLSNSDYVIGKTSGILSIFMGMVIIVLTITLVINYIVQDTPVVWQAYFLYPLLLTLPTIIYILGLSFLAMILVRNQSVTFILLLGYIGLTLFYLNDKFYGLWDYMAFNLPLVYSDFIGFADLSGILLHRMTYLFMGLAFICATILRLNRLPHGRRWNISNVILLFLFLISGGITGFSFYRSEHRVFQNRNDYKFINEMLAGEETPDILSNSIQVQLAGNELNISSEIALARRPGSITDTLNLSLNPGFRVLQITSQEKPVKFIRAGHVIRIIPPPGAQTDDTLEFLIKYRGSPVEDIAYLDIPDEYLLRKRMIRMVNIGKHYGIVSPHYVLLTPEMLWYPVGGITFNQKSLLPRAPDFTSFSLNVAGCRGLSVYSQGKKEISGDGKFFFRPENDLNGLSLVIGRYEELKTNIDSLELTLAYLPGHDFFSPYFTHIIDTIPDLIREYKNQYEIENILLKYPFKRALIIEVPVQFHAFERNLSQVVENVQPEMFLIPEKGSGLNTTDFKKFQFMDERRNRREDQVRTPEEIERDIFRRFVIQTFFIENTRSFGGMNMPAVANTGIMNIRGVSFSRNPFSAFPQYYSFKTVFLSDEIPFFNMMMESCLNGGTAFTPVRMGGTDGMTDIERANLTLRDHSLNEVINSWRNSLAPVIISQKGNFLMTSLKNKVGINDFDDFIHNYIETHRFETIKLEQFRQDFMSAFNVDINPYLESINTSSEIPGFIFSDIIYSVTRDDYGPVYLVRFSVTNTGKVKGLIDITFESGGRGGFGGGGFPVSSEPEERIVELDSSGTKEIQFMLYNQARIMTINTIISENVPATIRYFLRQPVAGKEDPAAFEKTLGHPVSKVYENEIVVDNEDPGFSYNSNYTETKLKKYIESKKKTDESISYSGAGMFRTPKKWTPVTSSGLYGTLRLSALVTSASKNGDQTARWKTRIPSASLYNIYVYLPVTIMRDRSSMFGENRGRRDESGGGSRAGGERGGTGPPGSGNTGGNTRGGRPQRGSGPGGMGERMQGMQRFSEEGTQYNYSIISNNGREDIEFVLSDIADGWNKIGSFDLPADTVMVELSNKSSGRRVVADAVKFVRVSENP